MLSRIGEKRANLDGLRNVIICDKFNGKQSFSPIILHKNHVDAKILFQNRVNSFDLSVNFRVIDY